jgi:hypothetical protein
MRHHSHARAQIQGILGLGYQAIAQPQASPPETFFAEYTRTHPGLRDAFGLLLCGSIIYDPASTDRRDYATAVCTGKWVLGGSSSGQSNDSRVRAMFSGPMFYTPLMQEAW